MTVSGLTTNAPPIGAELSTSVQAVPAGQAEAIALDHYGLAGTAEWLWGEKDSNYRLTLKDGRTFLFKVLNPGEDAALTDMHSRALLHVEQADPDVPVQRIIRTIDGETGVRIKADDGTLRSVRVVSFVPGISQKTVRHTPLQRHRVGAWMARLQGALRDFSHPASHHRISWDMTHGLAMRELLPAFGNRRLEQRLAAAVDQFEQQVLPGMSSLPAQVIHNDFNMENILVSETDPDTVTGIIDFGDMVHAKIVFDVAVGAAYQMGEDEDPVAAACDFLRGYSSVKTLSEAEIAALYPSILMRMVMRVTIPETRAQLFADQRERITRNSATVWRQFDRIDAMAEADVLARLAEACQGGQS